MERITNIATGFRAFEVRASSDHRMDPHAHEEHELNLVVSGSAVYFGEGDDVVMLAPGRVVFIPSGWKHTLAVGRQVYFKGLVIHPEVFAQLPECGQTDTASLLSTHAYPALRGRAYVAPHAHRILCDLHGHAAVIDDMNLGPFAGEAWRGVARLAALHTARIVSAAEDAAVALPIRERVLWVKAWLDRNFAEPVNTPALAAMAELSERYFRERFREVTGCSPVQYVNARRLDTAAILLAQTRLPVLEVAFTAGFQHLAHFNRCFKRHAGLTPTAYRRKHQAEFRNG